MMGGRGSGKTRAGAEWVHGLASGEAPGLGGDGRIALVAESFGDAREVMIDGMSGIMGVARDRAARHSRRRGAGWSGRRGRWRRCFRRKIPKACAGRNSISPGATSLANGVMPARPGTCCNSPCGSGANPRQLVTTTPRATPLMLALVKDAATRVTRISTEDNAGNLAAGFLDTIRARYGGTRLGRSGARWRADRRPRGRAVAA
jgi:phage terminase large subunit-like protein